MYFLIISLWGLYFSRNKMGATFKALLFRDVRDSLIHGGDVQMKKYSTFYLVLFVYSQMHRVLAPELRF